MPLVPIVHPMLPSLHQGKEALLEEQATSPSFLTLRFFTLSVKCLYMCIVLPGTKIISHNSHRNERSTECSVGKGRWEDRGKDTRLSFLMDGSGRQRKCPIWTISRA